MALVPLLLWAAFAGVKLAGGDYALVTAWIAQPLNAVLLGAADRGRLAYICAWPCR